MAPEQRVFRNQETRLMGTAFAVLNAGFAVTPWLFPEPLWTKALVSIAFLGFALLLFVRWRGQGIYVEQGGIQIRGGFSSRFLAWEEIAHFELRKRARDVVAHVVLADGTPVPARALNAGTGLLPTMKRRAQAQVDELNQLLERHHSPIS